MYLIELRQALVSYQDYRVVFAHVRRVHLECLREWQKSVLLTQPTHPKYHTSIDRVCNVCLEPFTGEGIPRSRHELGC